MVTSPDRSPSGHAAHAHDSRRAALKKLAAGAAVGAVVWNAPTIDGLSIRPDYAAASSTGTVGPVAATITADNDNDNWNDSSEVTIGTDGLVQIEGTNKPKNTNGSWSLVTTTLPTGCTTCTVISSTSVINCSEGPSVTGVPGTGGDAQCDAGDNLSVTFQITCS